MRTLGSAIALAAAVAAPCLAQSVAFVDVDVVPLDREGVLRRQTVVVTGNRITALGPSSPTAVPPGATRIDGRGKYLMPGLAEMHAHVIGSNNPNHAQLNRDILRHALASGQSGVDHLDGMLEAAMPDNLYERLRSGSPVPFEEQVNAVDPGRFAAVAAEIKAARSWQVPTILVWENLFSETNTIEEMAAWPELRYVSSQARASYATQKRNLQQNLRNTGATPELSAKYVDLRRRAVKALIDANVPLLMGTDSPQLFMVPGFALHRELAIIASLGVSPFRLYESGSKNVARYVAEKLGQDGRFGTVAVGNRADLVLLDANPLESVENLKRRAGVMVRGRWVSSQEIDRGLAQLAARHAQ